MHLYFFYINYITASHISQPMLYLIFITSTEKKNQIHYHFFCSELVKYKV